MPPIKNTGWFTCIACRWTRFWDTRPENLRRKLTHPIYGTITAQRLIDLDILNHDCDAATAAHNRAIQRKLYSYATTQEDVA